MALDKEWFLAESDKYQARILRLVLGYYEGDREQLASVLREVAADERGGEVASDAMLVALTLALADSWTRHVPQQQVADYLRAQLLALAAAEVDT